MPEQDRLHRFMTNNGRFRSEDAEYERVYMLNVMLPTQIAIMLFSYIATLVAVPNPAVGAITAVGALASALLFIYLHGTDAVRRTAHLNVCLLFVVVLLYCLVKGPRDYSYIFALLFPSVAYMMVGVRAGDRYVAAFVLCLGVMIGLSEPTWASTGFTIGMPVNFALTMVGMIVTVRYFERNRAVTADGIRALNLELRRSAALDGLTGLANRGKLEEVLWTELRKQNRHMTPLSVMMLDLDRFKDVNDAHGHMVGDRVLINTAQLLLLTLRETDTVGRFGGDEFLIILPDTNRDQLMAAASRLMDAAMQNNVAPAGTITYSVGGTSYRVGDTADDLIRRADMAMYNAKQKGRNQAAFLWADEPGHAYGPVPLEEIL